MSVGHATGDIGATAVPRREPAKLAPMLSHASAVLASLVAITAALALVAGVLGHRPLEVTPATSLALLLIAVALLFARRPRTRARRAAGRVLAIAGSLIAAAALAQDLIASWLLDDPGGGPAPALGWMAPNCALALLLAGAAIPLIDAKTTRRLRWPLHERLALAAMLIAFIALLGYLFRVPELYWLERATAMTLPTAIGILALATAILHVRLDRGLGGLLASEGLGGAVARRLLPAAVLIPTLLGIVSLAGARAGLYDTELDSALLTAATVVLFASVITWSASALGRVDAARVATLQALRDESVAREVERRRLRAVLDVLPVAVFIADSSGRFIDASAEASAVWGEAMPSSIHDELPFRGWDTKSGAPLATRDWPLSRAIATGRTYCGHELDVRTFDGKDKTLLSYAAPVRDENGRVAGGVAVAVDITERKRGERELASLKDELEERVRERTAELVAANAELEAFSYSVSHDLRAPLRWIDGFTRALAEDHGDELGPSGREYLRQLHESVDRMTHLIDALLWLSHVTMRPIDRERVSLGDLARDVKAELEASEPERQVEWRIDDVVVSGDGRLLRVVLDNLLRNAWKFTKDMDEAHIAVGAKTVNGELTCFVSDDGVGFDEAYADRLFRPFERLHAYDEFEGTGIGLALVRRIVVRHGGRVWAESHLGEGATFYFTLAPRRSAT